MASRPCSFSYCNLALSTRNQHVFPPRICVARLPDFRGISSTPMPVTVAFVANHTFFYARTSSWFCHDERCVQRSYGARLGRYHTYRNLLQSSIIPGNCLVKFDWVLTRFIRDKTDPLQKIIMTLA